MKFTPVPVTKGDGDPNGSAAAGKAAEDAERGKRTGGGRGAGTLALVAEDEEVCDSSRSISEPEELDRSAAALSSFVGRLLGRSGVGGGDAWLVAFFERESRCGRPPATTSSKAKYRVVPKSMCIETC